MLNSHLKIQNVISEVIGIITYYDEYDKMQVTLVKALIAKIVLTLYY